jgi:hypothetical protein
MARQPGTQSAPIEEPEINAAQALAEHQQASTGLVEIDKEFGDLVPYNRDRVVQETRFLLGQASDAMLEAGKRLIQLKEHEGHGGFLDALEAIGIHPRAAQRLMSASLKLSNTTTLSHLKKLPKCKVLEIATLDDSEIKELGEGGTVRGLKLDDVDRMSVRELQMALRTTRERSKRKADSDERLISQKNSKIDELQRQLDELMQEQAAKHESPPDWDGRAMQLDMDVVVQADLACQQIDKLASLRERIVALGHDCGEAPYRTMAVHYMDCIERLVAEMQALANHAHEVFGTTVEAAALEAADYRLSDLPTVGDMVSEFIPADPTLN